MSKMEKSPVFDGIRESWELKGKLEMLLDIVEAKFGSIPDGLRTRLWGLKTHEEIRQAMCEALSAGTIEEYEKVMGKARGEFKGKMEALLDVVEIKFGSVPNELRTRLGELQTHEEIRQAMCKAMSAGTIEEYMAKFKL